MATLVNIKQSVTATYNVYIGDKANGDPITDRVTLGHISKEATEGRIIAGMDAIGEALQDCLQKPIISADLTIRRRVLDFGQ